MSRILQVLFIFSLFVLVVGFSIAGELATKEGPSYKVGTSQVFDQQGQPVDHLAGLYQDWVDATLSGDDKAAQDYEKRLIALVNHDIAVTEARVRELARVAILEDPAGASADVEESAAESTGEAHQAFQRELTLLNTKEGLCRALNRTGAFSNKYRLLGNYIDLLRGELKTVRPGLASMREKPESDISGTSKTQQDK
jgi:hypothetical protein